MSCKTGGRGLSARQTVGWQWPWTSTAGLWQSLAAADSPTKYRRDSTHLETRVVDFTITVFLNTLLFLVRL